MSLCKCKEVIRLASYIDKFSTPLAPYICYLAANPLYLYFLVRSFRCLAYVQANSPCKMLSPSVSLVQVTCKCRRI
jgi:hypothetical protein